MHTVRQSQISLQITQTKSLPLKDKPPLTSCEISFDSPDALYARKERLRQQKAPDAPVESTEPEVPCNLDVVRWVQGLDLII